MYASLLARSDLITSLFSGLHANQGWLSSSPEGGVMHMKLFGNCQKRFIYNDNSLASVSDKAVKIGQK